MQRVVLITGVAGGIGYATAELFSQVLAPFAMPT